MGFDTIQDLRGEGPDRLIVGPEDLMKRVGAPHLITGESAAQEEHPAADTVLLKGASQSKFRYARSSMHEEYMGERYGRSSGERNRVTGRKD